MQRLWTLGLILTSLGSFAQGQDQDGEAPRKGVRADPLVPSTTASPLKQARPAVVAPDTATLELPGVAPLQPPRNSADREPEPPASSPSAPEQPQKVEATGKIAPPAATPPAAVPPTPQRTPGELFRSFLTTAPGTRMPGTAKSLLDVVRSAGPGPRRRQEQTLRIRAYWDLSAALAVDALARREQMELKSLQAGITTPGPSWQQALADTQARILLARQGAQVAQYQLQQLLDPQPLATIRDAALPIPADHPHCGVYDPHYDEIFRDHPSEFAWRLKELLGKQHQQLRSQTAAVEAALARLQQVSRQRAVQSDGSALLRAYQNLRLRRRLLVLAVHAYNRAIADYAQLAMPGSIEAGRLVAMLIYVKPDKQAVPRKQPDIQRPGGTRQLPSQPRQNRPKTFANTPATNGPLPDNPGAPPPPTEHSIVVPGRGR